MIAASIFDTAAFILAVAALSNSSLALIAPLAAFIPVFTTIFGFVFLHETSSIPKLIGIPIVVCGAYLLNVTDAREGLLAPLAKLFQVRGVKYFLIANLLWSLTPVLQKMAIRQTEPHSPTFVATVGTILISVYLIPVVLKRHDKVVQPIVRYKWWLLLCGVLVTFQQFALQIAISLANVGYVLAIGKLSSLFIVLWGLIFFKEGTALECVYDVGDDPAVDLGKKALQAFSDEVTHGHGVLDVVGLSSNTRGRSL